MGMVFRPFYKDQKTGEKKQGAIYHLKYYDNGKPISHTTGTKSETAAGVTPRT